MRKPKKSARINSNDSNGNEIEVTINFQSTNGLEASEVNSVVVKAVRSMADAIRSLPHTDFGPENTKISI